MENLNKQSEIFEILHLLDSEENKDKNNSIVNKGNNNFKSIEL